MPKPLELSGMRFGMLTVIRRVSNSIKGRSMWECLCDCGNTKNVKGTYLKNGETKSCGCARCKPLSEGDVFGRLTVAKRVGSTRYLCKCVCGKEKIITAGNLRSGDIKSCGCLKDENIRNPKTHGMSRSGANRAWAAMKARCDNKKHKSYAYYGGAGVTYDDDWKNFLNFYRDMGDRPHGGTLDRIDSSKGYCKNNCRWATQAEQTRNRRKLGGWSSKYKGVWMVATNRWESSLCFNGQHFYLGSFSVEEEAARAYDDAARRYFGEFACLNF